jgi:hypothetical protein
MGGHALLDAAINFVPLMFGYLRISLLEPPPLRSGVAASEAEGGFDRHFPRFHQPFWRSWWDDALFRWGPKAYYAFFSATATKETAVRC